MCAIKAAAGKLFKSLWVLVALVFAQAGMAQVRVDVTGVGLNQLPIAIAAFKGNEQAPQQIGTIVQADLERSGQFRAVDASGAALDELSRPDMAPWRQRGADSLVTGSVRKLNNGRFDVRFRLWDAVRGTDLGGQSFSVADIDLRLAAHRISDYVYEKLTGEKGVFSTRIAYVTKATNRYNLWVADADGEGAQSALASSEPIISPAWSPDGNQLAYVSFETRKPIVYIHEVSTGKRRLLASFRGSNSAPAWAPDGRSLAVTLSREGGSQLFNIDAAGGEPRRVVQSPSIDTEAVFSPSGEFLYFVSDRGGAPQIYRMPVAGGSISRVTFAGNYNISPALSPDGRWMAYVSREGGGYKLKLMELGSGSGTTLTDTTSDESPSFAPNSKLIIYATVQGGRDTLMTTTLDGRTKSRLSGAPGDLREPAWGPFLK